MITIVKNHREYNEPYYNYFLISDVGELANLPTSTTSPKTSIGSEAEIETTGIIYKLSNQNTWISKIGSSNIKSAIESAEDDIEAGNVILSRINSSGKSISASIRPNDTTPYGINDVVGNKSIAATGTLTFTGVVSDGELVVIGADVYEFDTDTSITAGHIQVDVSGGVTAPAAVTALAAAITASDTQGVGGVDGTGDTVVLTADTAGATANEIITTKTCVNASFNNATLIGGITAENLEFLNVLLAYGQQFIITGITLEVDAAAVPTGMQGFKLYLFDSNPTVQIDNVTFNLIAADRIKYLGVIPLSTPVDIGDTLWSQNDNINFNGKLATASTTLYGILTTDTVYAPSALTIKKLTIYTVGV